MGSQNGSFLSFKYFLLHIFWCTTWYYKEDQDELFSKLSKMVALVYTLIYGCLNVYASQSWALRNASQALRCEVGFGEVAYENLKLPNPSKHFWRTEESPSFILFFLNFIATVQFSFRIHFFRNSDSKCIKLHIFNSGCCYLFNENLYIKFICQFWQQCYCWKVCWEISLWSVSAVTCIIPVQWEALKLIWSNICFEYNI